MIKFFRKIRHRLLTENKFSKYLLYAIGEIALVVIGILLALSINNWNESKKDRILEESILIRLHSDLVADTTYLVNRLKRINEFKTRQYKFIHEIFNTQNTEEEFRNLYRLQSWDSENLVMQTSTYEELKNNSLINIIRNEQLRIAMISLYREYEIAAQHIYEINNWSSREIFSKSGSVAMKYNIEWLYDEKRLFEGLDWQFINDPSSENFKLLENTQMHYHVKYGVFIRHFENLLTKSSQLLDKINLELNNIH